MVGLSHSPSPRLVRLIEHLHSLGSRSVGAALLELADPVVIERCLESYARLDPGILEVVDGRDFPPLPLMVVPTLIEDEIKPGMWRRLNNMSRRVISSIGRRVAPANKEGKRRAL